MLTLSTSKLSNRLSKTTFISEINDMSAHHAVGVFNDYKARGVILNDNYDDSRWLFTNQTKNVGILFDVDSVSDWIGCTTSDYSKCIKLFVTFQLGKLGLIMLQSIVYQFRLLAAMTAGDACRIDDYLNHVIVFLELLPAGCESRDYVIETLEERANHTSADTKKQRVLARFYTYLKFDEIISRHWNSIDQFQKIVYFPLYFWWKLTAILPLRPTEFLLTPRDCLQGKMLTVRRTRLKGKGGHVNYNINGDYELRQYEISDQLASDLNAYINATDSLTPNKIDTLLIPVTGYAGNDDVGDSRYYTYRRLRQCLLNFYNEIIFPSKADIDVITLGDTRHLAMINLIISGGSPTVCRELAGHADIDVSSHYYANISNLVECVTIERLRNGRGGKAGIVGRPHYALTKPNAVHRVSNGWCDALSVKNGDVGECLKVMSNNGHIGECTCCGHFWPDDEGLWLSFYDDKLGKQRIKADTEYLLQMIEVVRRGLGYTEDIGSAVLRLQRSCDHYSKCILERIEHG